MKGSRRTSSGGGITDERRPKKHRDFIEPGSKEDKEATEALNEALGAISERSKEQHLREKRAADAERERRIGEGLPLEDDCYFARLAGGLRVEYEDLFGLWEEARVAIRLTGRSVAVPASPDWKPDPKDYLLHERATVSALLRLTERGGYAWLEFDTSKKAKVGVVTPGTGIEVRTARRAPKKQGKRWPEGDAEVVLATVRLQKVVYLQVDEEITLRASRPLMPDHVGRNLVPWEPACGAGRIASMFDGARPVTPKERWNSLPPDLQLTVCTEFLRDHGNRDYPRLKRLLLPPTALGRSVDICGVTDDGTEILAQVPFRTNREKEGFEAKKKAERLRRYEGLAKLICFVPGSEDKERNDGRDQKLFEDRSPIIRDGVLFIPVEEVLRWIEAQPGYAKRLFPA